jgi:xylulokinase
MSQKDQLLLSMDVGTTAIKVGLFSMDGQLMKIATEEQCLTYLEGGWVEQSPRQTWNLVVEATRRVIIDFHPKSIRAIVLSVHRGTVIPLRADGEPLSNFLVWMDKRGLPIVEELIEKPGRAEYYNISGHPISHVSGISKVLWLYRHSEEYRSEIALIASPETLFLKWLGCKDLVCTYSTGTYLFPFDIDGLRWSSQIAEKLDFPLQQLPQLVSSIEIVGKLSQEAAEAFGLPAGIPLVPGGGDGQCAGLGCGIVRAGLSMINIGTGTGVQTFLPRPLKDPNHVLNCAAHVIPGAWEMEGHTQSSGAVFKWFRDELGAAELSLQHFSKLDAFDLLIEQAVSAPPGSGGLIFLPVFNGSTAPKIDQDVRGAFLGLSLAHKRNHLIRALLEGITLEIRWMVDAMVEVGAPIEEIRLVGGGAGNPLWNQIHADILGCPIKTLQVSDAALVGAAMCAAVAVGGYRNLNETVETFVKVNEIIEPLPKNLKVYRTAYKNYQKAYTLLSESGLFIDLKRQLIQ